MKLHSHRMWVGMLLSGALLLACEVAFARAGGGGGFSGGGGGGGFSGGGGGDGGGSGIIIYLLLRLVIQYPLIGIPLLIVIGFVFYHSSKGINSAYVSQTIRRGIALDRSSRVSEALEKVEQRDPAFNLDAFFQRCREQFPQVQEAWSRQDMTPVRHFISDGVFDRFSLQIEIQKGSGIRNDMRDVRVLEVGLVGAASDRFFDTLHVAVTAEAVDTTIALEGGRRLQGTGTPEAFTEIWTFLRRPGVKTLERPGLLEGFCPNCGARLKLSTSITCESCQALINSGEYDWVLAEITQEEVWSPHVVEQMQGVAEMERRDPGFNAQAIEDRVSALFWRHRAAEFFGRDEYVRAVALPAFVSEARRAWQPDDSGCHPFYADAAVGSVDLAEVIPGGERDDLDRVRVRVQWSGHREVERVPGLFRPEWERSRLMMQEYVLARTCGVQSAQSSALTSLHCTGCGAPQIVKQDGRCRYCGLQQNDGSTSWVLESVSAFRGFAQAVAETAEPQQLLAGVRLSPQERESMILCVIAVMLADGVVDPQEDKQLAKMAAKHSVSPARVKELIHQAQADNKVSMPQLDDWEKRRMFFKALVQMCLADGNVSVNERRVLRSLVTRMGYSDVDIDMMITQERAALYAASKAALKASKG